VNSRAVEKKKAMMRVERKDHIRARMMVNKNKHKSELHEWIQKINTCPLSLITLMAAGQLSRTYYKGRVTPTPPVGDDGNNRRFGRNFCHSSNKLRWQKHVGPLTPAVIKNNEHALLRVNLIE
jgi:hypothetical protein